MGLDVCVHAHMCAKMGVEHFGECIKCVTCVVFKKGKCLNTYNCALVNVHALFHRKTLFGREAHFHPKLP